MKNEIRTHEKGRVMTTKQFSHVTFDKALFMNPAVARDMLEQVEASDESSFAIYAARHNNADAQFWRTCTEHNLKKAIGIFDRADANPKTYDIYYIIKANRHQTVHCMTVVAGNVRDAKTIVDYAVLRETSRNAFSKTNGKLPGTLAWDRIMEVDGVTEDEIKQQAKTGGYLAI